LDDLMSLQDLQEAGQRMKADPAYFFRLVEDLIKVRDRRGTLSPLLANAAQRLYEAQRGRQNIVLKARQMGMTTWIAASFFLRTITTPGTMTLQVAHTRGAAESIFRMVQRMWQLLPDELREGPLKRSRANVGQMIFPALDSEFRIASACDEGVGRGLTVQNLHCSEVSRWPGNSSEILAGLRAALAPGGELVLESTPNGAYGTFYEEWCEATESYGPSAEENHQLVRHFLPWWLEPAYTGKAVDVSTLTEEEGILIERHGLNAGQIGFRRGLEHSYGELRSQEFAEDAETCFRATGMCCFDVNAIERRMLDLPTVNASRRSGALQVWLPRVSDHEYLVAVDTAGGGAEGDFAAVQVLEMATGLQCAELQQRLRPAELAHAAAELAREYNGAMIVVERNNHGAAVLAYLDTSERYDRVWGEGRETGWLTTAASKPAIIARLGSLLEQTPERFMSRRLLGECRTYVSGERGRSGAASGSHDDLVMAMAIGHAVRARVLESGGRSVDRNSVRHSAGNYDTVWPGVKHSWQ
jgi:hypothetical protein